MKGHDFPNKRFKTGFYSTWKNKAKIQLSIRKFRFHYCERFDIEHILEMHYTQLIQTNETSALIQLYLWNARKL